MKAKRNLKKKDDTPIDDDDVGANGNETTDDEGGVSKMKAKTNLKKKADTPIDDDVGANGDETTDDEGGVDTPPPANEEEEDSKQEEDVNEKLEEQMQNSVDLTKNKKDAGTKNKKDDGEYEVDQIVDMEVSKRKKCPVSFRVRWVGFTEKDDSWLPAVNLSCDDMVQDFLEVSGRKPEYERAFESRKRAAEWSAENQRHSSRKSSRVQYSELDEDEDEILPSGTRTRKIKTKAEKKDFSGEKGKKKKKMSSVLTPTPRNAPKQQQEFEVEKIVDHRVKGRFTEYKVRWKGFSSKEDEWILESNLNCPSLVKSYNKNSVNKEEAEESFEVEAIAGMRERKGRVEYKVRWKNWGAKYDSWLPEEELSCSDVLANFKRTLDKLEKQQDWQVEKILDSRVRKGKTEFYIHWAGFESKFDTWEPEENLEGCNDIVEKYVKEQEKQKDKLLKSGRKTREDRPRPERYVENFTGGSRSKSKRKSAGTSYSEFYDQ